MRILIAGGAGFVGSSLALLWKEAQPDAQIVALDNLRRRGGEFNLPILRQHGIEFVHGDVRNPTDFNALQGQFDLLIEASAEPSVHAGHGEDGPGYVFDTNLFGALNCLEFARKRVGCFVFLSTSRVYAIEPLRTLQLTEGAERFQLQPTQPVPGVTERGISEAFPTHGARSFYGTSKLAAEQLVEEYAHNYQFPAIINRCGLIAGPGQWGKTDQGVLTLWLAHHYFGKPLRYTGFGGEGKQVRDVIHPRDLFDLLSLQINSVKAGCPPPYNVGGGEAHSVSLLQWTKICQEATGHTTEIARQPESAAVDVPYYTSDSTRAQTAFQWQPKLSPRDIAGEIAAWFKEYEAALRPFFVA